MAEKKTLEFKRPLNKDGKPMDDEEYDQFIQEVIEASKGENSLRFKTPSKDFDPKDFIQLLENKKASGGYVKKYAYGGRVAKSSAEKS